MRKFPDVALSILRIVSGFLFFSHGAMKLFGWFGGMPSTPKGFGLPPLLFTAGVVELAAGALIFIGLFACISAFIASGEMAFAYFIGHFPHGFWPVQNHGELAVLYCFIFLFLSANGPGRFSLDRWIQLNRT